MIQPACVISRGAIGLLIWMLWGSNLALSQVVGDTTLPRPSQVGNQGNALVITDGTEAGTNLFHSFREFSVPNGRTASFRGVDPAITHIFSRVTGSRISRIDGTIEVLRSDGSLSAANLFLLNPNGIVFGRNASLNVGGSFLATTANRINFADGTPFSAVTPQLALLTISLPVGLQFGRNPGNIVNRSTQVIRDTQGNPALFDGESYPGGLQVRPDRTVALVGGNVDLLGGYLFTASGRIELGSVISPGQVSLSTIDEGWRLGYEGIQKFGRIRLSQGGSVDTSGSIAVDAGVGGGGAIQIQAGQVSLTDGSQILSVTEGTASGQRLSIHAIDSITLSGIVSGINSGFSTTTVGSGNAGDVLVSTRSLIIQDGASVNSITNANGKSGSLNIRASDAVILDSAQPNFGTGLVTQTGSDASGNVGDIRIRTGRLMIRNASLGSLTLSSGRGGDVSIQAQSIDILGNGLLYSQTQGNGVAGRAGNITLQTQQLRSQEGGAISSTTFGSGRAGDITVKATDIAMAGILLLSNGQPQLSPEGLTFPGGIFSGPDVRAIGNGGQILVETQRLRLSGGAVLQTNTYGSGAAGNLTVRAREAIEISGTAPNALSPTGLLAVSGGLPGQNFRAVRQATGAGGNLNITTRQFTVREGAVVAVSSINPQATGAGRLQIRAQNILLDRGLVDAQTESGSGANIDIRQAEVLLLRRNSAITTSAGTESGGGTGGNIDIQSNFILANPDENSDITANAIRENAGNITLNEKALIGIAPQEQQTIESDITASSEFGNSGVISFNTPRIDPTRGLVALASDPVDASQLIDRQCTAGNEPAQRLASEFVMSGRGGLPPSPTDLGTTQAVLTDWATLDAKPVPPANRLPPPVAFREGVSEADRSSHAGTIAEAQGWVIDKSGVVILTTQATGRSYPSELAPACAAQLSQTHHP
ncbi:MAG: filamentous hemagglutinin N-terminal domain-containing protein [Drouetiella hepatica Uher 2000/2452]|jgi:filamentous hemagglutinin family protein|uniref:Filamentous hemagglutinin N-terminal domain-containing protein n=1 Tax=Drouetiella hepatica Uher 2000/2452 TaxID=904376 RepID=A0A951Q9Y5_9CYAN|nr:filamentous hemagglutinin N-terminal domain-containing protein [Drouetiella hepatica Uher 2000/2452]